MGPNSSLPVRLSMPFSNCTNIRTSLVKRSMMYVRVTNLDYIPRVSLKKKKKEREGKERGGEERRGKGLRDRRNGICEA